MRNWCFCHARQFWTHHHIKCQSLRSWVSYVSVFPSKFLAGPRSSPSRYKFRFSSALEYVVCCSLFYRQFLCELCFPDFMDFFGICPFARKTVTLVLWLQNCYCWIPLHQVATHLRWLTRAFQKLGKGLSSFASSELRFSNPFVDGHLTRI